MSYTVAVYAQDDSVGRVQEVLRGVDESAKAAGPYTHLEAAVAYASRAGAQLLADRLQTTPAWSSCTKRFLVSIDFGITEPGALTFLSGLPNAEVRIPNASAVLANSRLMPPRTFHAKGYLFRGPTWSSPSGLILGSANMTVSALATGSEVLSGHCWSGRASRADTALLGRCRPFLDWFEDAWNSAEPVASVLRAYRGRYRASTSPKGPAEERTPTARAFAASLNTNVVAGGLAAQLMAARAIWFQTDVLYDNRGPNRPGSQLDTPRGTRVFFGFPATKVNKNHIFGYVSIQVPGHAAVSRSVKFASNSMDKVNLPIPGKAGPPTYDNSIVVFERTDQRHGGLPLFRLTVTDVAGLRRLKRQARNHVDLQMGGARQRAYGLLF